MQLGCPKMSKRLLKTIGLMFPIEIAILGGSPIFGTQSGLLVICPFLVLFQKLIKYVFVPGFSLGGSSYLGDGSKHRYCINTMNTMGPWAMNIKGRAEILRMISG